MKNKDQQLLEEAYEKMYSTASKNSFEDKIKARSEDNYYVIGMTPEGKKYAVIDEYEKYDDGDRWYEETNYYYQIEGEEKGKYISNQLAKELKIKAFKEHPELNKHVPQDIIDWYL